MEDWGTLLYNLSRRDKRDPKIEPNLSSPRQGKPFEATPKDGSVVTTVNRSDDDLPDPSGTPRRQKLFLRRSQSIVTQKLSYRMTQPPKAKQKRSGAMHGRIPRRRKCL